MISSWCAWAVRKVSLATLMCCASASRRVSRFVGVVFGFFVSAAVMSFCRRLVDIVLFPSNTMDQNNQYGGAGGAGQQPRRNEVIYICGGEPWPCDIGRLTRGLAVAHPFLLPFPPQIALPRTRLNKRSLSAASNVDTASCTRKGRDAWSNSSG